jgi:hypothetical protein
MRERANCHPLFESYDRSGDRKSQKKPRLGRRACLASAKQTYPRRGLLISQIEVLQNSIRGQGKALSREWYRIAVRRVRWRMAISFARHQFSPAAIRHAVWLYIRLTHSYRDVDDLLAERGLHVSYETVRSGRYRFPKIASHRADSPQETAQPATTLHRT